MKLIKNVQRRRIQRKKKILSTVLRSVKPCSWTLSISATKVSTSLRLLSQGHTEKDRLVMTPTERLKTAQKKENIRLHISKFPTVESHYCRATTKWLYLGSELCIRAMYSHYKLSCSVTNEESLSYTTYRNIFNTEFNLGSHQQKIISVIFAPCWATWVMTNETIDGKS